MSLALPQLLTVSVPLRVDRCASNPFGETDMICSLAGVSLKPFSLPQSVDVVGFDAIRGAIESQVLDQLEDALEAAK